MLRVPKREVLLLGAHFFSCGNSNGHFHNIVLVFHNHFHSDVRVPALLYKEESRVLRTDCIGPRYIRNEQNWSKVPGSRVKINGCKYYEYARGLRCA
jgi:hypothetical protein